MKPFTFKPLILALIPMLHACGGGGSGGGNTHTAPEAPQETVRDSINLSPITLAPLRAERPDADTQAQIDIAVAETNRLRSAVGRAPLHVDQSLAAYAAVRARESAGRFAHNRPGDSKVAGDDAMFNRGRNIVIGENLQKGTQDPKQAIEYLKNSSGHYKNMIEPDYAKIGIGYYASGATNGHYWAQIFTDNTTTSKFRFITPLAHNEAEQAIRAITRYDNHHLNIQLPRNDALAIKSGSGILGAPHVGAVKTDHRILLRPYRDAGWSYQTFGEIIDDSAIPEAYVNLGKTHIPAADAVLRAHYRGQAVGDLGQHSRVTADVAATLDYGQSAKTLTIQLSNSQRGSRDLERGQSGRLTPASTLDFSDTLNWNAEIGQFESATGSARLYGPNAEELGGQFARKVDGEHYRGAYGASRVAE